MNHSLTTLSDQIWSFAETGFTETQSCNAMCEYLEKEGFEVKKHIADMDTAYKATWGSGKPVITFLTEYDALFGMNQTADVTEYRPFTSNEGTGHGCGHHLLGVGAIAAAVEYRNYLKENNLEGTVEVLGCPAEEAGRSGQISWYHRAGCLRHYLCSWRAERYSRNGDIHDCRIPRRFRNSRGLACNSYHCSLYRCSAYG